MDKEIWPITRRAFLRTSGFTVAAIAAGRFAIAKASEPLNLANLKQFVDPLPMPEILKPIGTRPSPREKNRQLPFYRLSMREIQYKIHRDLPTTRVWGFGASSPGPTFEVKSGEEVLVEWANDLPRKHFLPIDYSVHGAEADKPQVRVVTHLHGANAPASSDGFPEDWYEPGKSVVYHYPNHQEAAHLWYHDHALGITRLNVYAGLVGSYFVRDAFEANLNLPSGSYEIPLTFFDRSLDSEGQLRYPTSGDEKAPWVSEVFGEATLINGKLFPFLEAEPRKYRLRLLNASNARFFRLSFSKGLEFHQVGTDLGLLPAPVPLKQLLLAPGERADLVVNFNGAAGGQIVLVNDGQPVLQFRISKSTSNDTSSLPSQLRPVPPLDEATATKTRILTIGEQDDKRGMAMRMLLNNAHWSMPITENPVQGSVEIWNLLNFTDDSHPIHLHAVRFQILDRRSFEPQDYYHGGQIHYIGPVVQPAPNEAGWKDTVQAHPGMVTRIIVRFDAEPGRYVWHCHILEHEDNEMMRPYEILART